MIYLIIKDTPVKGRMFVMYRFLAILAVAMAAIMLGGQDALAICHDCTHPAPAPLLAAGIPAFAALGGGVAVTRIVRRFRRRS